MIGWREACAVVAGGGIGSLLRYAVTAAVSQRLGPGFPWWTFLINVSGSFVIGLVAEFSQTRAVWGSPLIRIFLIAGVLGGYTTFSTFSLDALTLAGDRAAMLAAVYVVASVAFGIVAAFCGVALARALSLP